MWQTILEEIDDQRGLAYQGSRARPHRWIRAVTTYGVLLPDVERLWSAWWSLDTIGRAMAAMQYISCLMYPENENPVFAAWTANDGGDNTIRAWLGHVSLDTTQVYAEMDLEMKARALEKCDTMEFEKHTVVSGEPLMDFLRAI
jgi:hypothetical protein